MWHYTYTHTHTHTVIQYVSLCVCVCVLVCYMLEPSRNNYIRGCLRSVSPRLMKDDLSFARDGSLVMIAWHACAKSICTRLPSSDQMQCGVRFETHIVFLSKVSTIFSVVYSVIGTIVAEKVVKLNYVLKLSFLVKHLVKLFFLN